MPKQKPQQKNDHGKTLIEWSFPEFTKHQRGQAWYFWAGLIFAGLLIYSLFTANFLFAVIIMMSTAILYIQSKRKPIEVNFKITEDGLEIGNSFYEYKSLKSFWIIYEPPETKSLYLDFKASLKPTLAIPLKNQNPVVVRKNLLKYIDEDLEKEEEPFVDVFARRFKI